VFHIQIEKKQRELQPWNEKANKAKAELDIARSERSELAKKAEATQFATQAAQDDLAKLHSDQEAKARA
jgi:structural maintenance of chromosome 4